MSTRWPGPNDARTASILTDADVDEAALEPDRQDLIEEDDAGLVDQLRLHLARGPFLGYRVPPPPP